jgi:hypothetical protein
MFAYARAPIDFWPGWLTETELKRQLVDAYAPGDAARALDRYEKLLDAAHETRAESRVGR